MKGLMMFAVGATVGGLAAWYFTRKYYEHELEDMEKFYEGEEIIEEDGEAEETESKLFSDTEITDFLNDMAEKAKNKNYSEYAKMASSYRSSKEDKKVNRTPYRVSMSDWNKSNFDRYTFDYYSDGILANADDPDTPFMDQESVFGDVLDDLDYDTLEGENKDWLFTIDGVEGKKYEICMNDKPFEEREY